MTHCNLMVSYQALIHYDSVSCSIPLVHLRLWGVLFRNDTLFFGLMLAFGTLIVNGFLMPIGTLTISGFLNIDGTLSFFEVVQYLWYTNKERITFVTWCIEFVGFASLFSLIHYTSLGCLYPMIHYLRLGCFFILVH